MGDLGGGADLMTAAHPSAIASSNPFGNDHRTKIMLHMEGANAGTTFIDTAYGVTAAHSWTASSATTSTTQVKFGSTSLSCGAAAGYVSMPDTSDVTHGSGDWTIDLWFYRSGGDGTTRYICGQWDGSTATAAIRLATTNVIIMTVYASAVATSVTGTTTFTATGWHHVAGVRTGNTLKLFIDGTQEGGDVAFSSTVDNTAAVYAVGALGAGVNPFNGFIDEFRLSIGVARWTSNFTAPTGPYG